MEIFLENIGWDISKRIIFAPHLRIGREGDLTHPLPLSKFREGGRSNGMGRLRDFSYLNLNPILKYVVFYWRGGRVA
jgi:hypothetical protein